MDTKNRDGGSQPLATHGLGGASNAKDYAGLEVNAERRTLVGVVDDDGTSLGW